MVIPADIGTGHAPMIACIGNLYWCTCQEPDWESAPRPGDDHGQWVRFQPFYEPEEFTAHIVAVVLSQIGAA